MTTALPYQQLAEPGALAAPGVSETGRVFVAGAEYASPAELVGVDASEHAWDGDPATLVNVTAFVPPAVRDYVVGQKLAASLDVAENPALATVRAVAPQFEGATKAARDRLAAIAAEYDEAVAYDKTSAWAVNALLAPKREKARAEVRDVAETWRKTFDAQLKAAEQDAEAAVAAVGRTNLDWEVTARDFMSSLALLTPARAMDAVLGLAQDVAAGRARAERVVALLPALASAVETRPGFDTAEMRQAVRVLQIAGRDRKWYAAHGTLAAVRNARVKLEMFAEQWLDALHGRGPSPSAVVERGDSRTTWYADLGVAAQPKAERRWAPVPA